MKKDIIFIIRRLMKPLEELRISNHQKQVKRFVYKTVTGKLHEREKAQKKNSY